MATYFAAIVVIIACILVVGCSWDLLRIGIKEMRSGDVKDGMLTVGVSLLAAFAIFTLIARFVEEKM